MREELRLPVAGLIGGLALAIAAKFILPNIPLISTLNGQAHISLSTANGYCSGVIGAFVRGFGGAAANTACNNVGGWELASNLAAVAGLALAGWSGYVLYRQTRP